MRSPSFQNLPQTGSAAPMKSTKQPLIYASDGCTDMVMADTIPDNVSDDPLLGSGPASSNTSLSSSSRDNSRLNDGGLGFLAANEAVSGALQTGAPKTRSLSLMQFSLMLFMVTAAGPYGIESLVRSSAPFYALIALCVVPFIYCLPQSLMCAELSAMIPTNHGSVGWVYRALGPMAGFFYAMNDAMSTWTDTPTYIVLINSYCCSTVINSNHDPFISFAIKFGFVILGFILTAMNVRTVGQSSYVMTAMILLPFAIAVGYAAPSIDPSDWLRTKTIKDDGIDWPLYISSVIWLHTGFDTLSHCSGEVGFTLSKFFSGFVFAIILDFLSYMIPLICLFAVAFHKNDGEKEDWKEGFVLDAMKDLSPWLGPWVLLGALASNFGLYAMEVTTLSREIWAMSQASAPPSQSLTQMNDAQSMDDEIDIAILPAWMGALWKRTDAPVIAVAMISIVNLFLVNLPFGLLIEISTFQNCLSFVLEYLSFLYLRYSEPNEPRPFLVPGGLMGAWVVTLTKLCLVFTLFAVTLWQQPLIFVACVGLNCGVLLPYYWLYIRPRNRAKQERRIRKQNRHRTKLSIVQGDGGEMTGEYAVNATLIGRDDSSDKENRKNGAMVGGVLVKSANIREYSVTNSGSRFSSSSSSDRKL